ncbi:MAG: hypothetical protein ACF8TS_05240 [Maioricimonas sp. JB049]
MHLRIDPGGTIRCLYDESLPLSHLGAAHIRRASHVEPTTEGCWTADLSPVSGPLLGPFRHRSQALDVERQWLEQHWLTQPG